MKVALRDFPVIRAHYYDADGEPKPIGGRIKNPDLARLLERIARNGANGFYLGWPERAIESAVAGAPRNQAKLTAAEERKSTRMNSRHECDARMTSSARQ